MASDSLRTGKSFLHTIRYFAWLLILSAVVSGKAQNLSIATAGSPSFNPPTSGGGDSGLPVISRNGQYVLFSSAANNLVLNSNGLPYRQAYPVGMNVFLRDRSLGSTVLVSVDDTGTSEGNDNSIPTAISTNGQFVLFESAATNLVLGVNNGITSLFTRDLTADTTMLVSVGTNSTLPDGASTDSIMTPEGRFIAFSSLANNLVAGDTNGVADVFVWDRLTGSTTLVSVGGQDAALSQFNAGRYYGTSASDLPEITPDGRYVAFLSSATNLVPGITNFGEVYVRDLSANQTYCVSSNPVSYLGNFAAFSHRISTNGQYIVFEALPITLNAFSMTTRGGVIIRHNLQNGLDNLISTNAPIVTYAYKYVKSVDMTPDGRFVTFIVNTNFGSSCVMLWDAQTATSTLVSVGADGSGPPNSTSCSSPAIDPSGRFISFQSTAGNLVTNSVTAGSLHLYVRDLQAGVTALVDVTTNANASASATDISQSIVDTAGSIIAFDSTGTDLATNDSNGCSDVFVRDTVNNFTELVSAHHSLLASYDGHSTGMSYRFNVSTDGRFMAFASSGLDSTYTNRFRGVFVRDLIYQTNLLVSVTTNGLPNANGASMEPMISGNGRYVVFTSYAANLSRNDTNFASDVFIYDLQSGTNQLVSANAATNGSAYGSSFAGSVSYDGRYVLFFNSHQNTNYTMLRDRTLGTNYMLAVGTNYAAMTPDGHYVAFTGSLNGLSSSALYVWDAQAGKRVFTNFTSFPSLVTISTNGQWLAFVASSVLRAVDRIANTNIVIGGKGNFGPHASLKFSGDARFLLYSTTATNVAFATNGLQKVYLYDSQTGSNTLVSQCYFSANTADADSISADISVDGRFVVYESKADNIVPSGLNGVKGIFLYDRVAGATTLLSASCYNTGAGDGFSIAPEFTGDGQTVAFYSFASDLVANDFNGSGDLFDLELYSTNSLDGSTNPPVLNIGQTIYMPGSGQTSPSPTLNWVAAPGITYQVLFKDNLTDPVWQILNGTITITGNAARAVDLSPNPVHRFYQIEASQP
ncbi:MAG TPA: hypothetical protein VK742_19320 [Candidatus Sulfotelmatobacter sp.]|nr:hypothetical protein [Candidatus Sulfotelmatobacter sp.]